MALQDNFDGRFFKRSVGKFKVQKRWICFGIPGQADIYGWLRVGGKALHFECEVKLFPDKLSKQQVAWKNLCKEQGVLYIVSRSPDEAVRRVKELCKQNT